MTGSTLSTPRLILGAVVLGTVISLGGLYASGAFSGIAETDLAGSCPARSPLAEAVAATAAGEVATMVAVDASDFSTLAFTGPDGAAMTLGDLAGRTLLVNLWATWCAPCREEMPALDALQRDRGGVDFEVVALNLDRGDDDKPDVFFEETDLQHLVKYRDGTLGVFNRLRGDGLVLGLPVTFLVDDNGCLAAQMTGPAHWDSADAYALIDAVLAAAPGS